uniref:Beta-1,4-glucuronyltransferase 1 n=1 Tax=Strigamia maritima TaxID=126957 RepID=T1JA84_STRMM
MLRRRPVPCAVVFTFLSALTIYNMMLGFRLIPMERAVSINSNDTIRASFHDWFDNPHPSISINTSDVTHQLHFRSTIGRLDTRRRYKIHDFLVIGKKWDQVSNGRVCLATQTSLDRFSTLGEVTSEWQGPVSVTVFAPDQEFPLALRYITFLQNCFPAVNDNVSFHMVYPANRPPAYSSRLDTEPLVMNCNQPQETLTRVLKLRPLSMMQWRDMTLYPQNHLRNVARKNCQSPYVFQTDVDIIPRRGLAISLAMFLRRPDVCDPCSFVVPTYEVEASVPRLPLTKSELIKLVNKRQAQPFHKVIFIYNQYATNNTRWEQIPEKDDMDAAYKVTNYEFFYEPFYVSKDSVPPHDERFVGYGFTRNTQVYEMVLAGYKLWVLNNAFALHRGLVMKKTRPLWRERQNSANAHLLDGFKKEVAVKYSRVNQHKKRPSPR